MGRLADMAGERTHVRTIEMTTRRTDDFHILCTGRFRDVRLFPSTGFLGNDFEAGDLHNLTIHVLVRTPELVIEDIEVSIDVVPLADCPAVAHSLDAIVGQSITRGFTATVKNLAGGRKGCTHLVHLLTTMAPAMLQGYWAVLDDKRSRTGLIPRDRAASSAAFLKDSCYAWREDGSAFGLLRDIAGVD